MPSIKVEFEPVKAGLPNTEKGWKDRDALAAMLASAPPAPQAIAPELDVRKIMLAIEPGPDGCGEEVYAKSVNDVVDMLTKMDQELEEWQLGIKRLPAPQTSVVQQEPVAWKHDCAALLTNDVELWIDACPHCGKPRTHPPQQAKPQPLSDEQTKQIAVLKSCLFQAQEAAKDLARQLLEAHHELAVIQAQTR